jgi:hypothetical protein
MVLHNFSQFISRGFTVQTFVYRVNGKTTRTPVRIVGGPAEILTMRLPNKGEYVTTFSVALHRKKNYVAVTIKTILHGKLFSTYT